MAKDFIAELTDYVALPSVSAQPAHAKDCAATARWVSKKLENLGFAAKLVPTGGHPLVYARREATGKSAPHIVIYGHYDVQPAEPLNLWKTPAFKLTAKAGKLIGRGAADNKGPTLALLYGLAGALKKKLNLKITCLIEGEEEIGSKNLPATLKKLQKQIGHVDAVILSDTDSPAANRLAIATGVRGLLAFDLTIKGLARDLHSGNGGPVPNATRELARVLGGVFDAQGWVNIPHFYDGITAPAKAELLSLRKTLSAKKFAQSIGASGFYPLSGKSPFEVNRFFPSFEVNGIYGGYQGEGAKTIIPAEATAKITCRIAPGQDPETFRQTVLSAMLKRVDKHLFACVISTPEGAPNPAYATPLPHLDKSQKTSANFTRALQVLEKSCTAVIGHKPLYLREGGSIGILSDFKKILGADSIMLGLALEDSLMHSPNENADIKTLENGMKVWQRFFEEMGS